MAFPCSLLFVDGYRFPFGLDAAVYLWWMRLGGEQGMAVVGERAGSVAGLTATGSTLHLSAVNAVGGTSIALGAAVALAAAALLRSGRSPRTAWMLGGVLAGAFAIHIVAGYVATVSAVVPFLAAATLIAVGTRPAVVAAALLLGAAGLAHPIFLLVDLAILAAAAAWGFLEGERGPGSSVRAIGGAVVGGVAITGAGALVRILGPGPLVVDTSRDAFLRRAGFSDLLHRSYVERFAPVWQRYVPWAAVPLAAAGLGGVTAFRRRFLGAWAGLTIVGVLVALASRRLPPSRFATYGLAIPILAGAGAVALWRLGRAVYRTLAVALVLTMIAGAFIGLRSQAALMTPEEASRSQAAARIAETTAPGTPLVFVVDADASGAATTSLATRVGDLARASVPPDRVRDVYVYVGSPRRFFLGRPSTTGDPEYDALSRSSLDAIPTDASRPPLTIVLAPFDETASGDLSQAGGLFRWDEGVYASEPGTIGEAPPARDPLVPSSPLAISLSALAVLGLLVVLGYGWARAVLEDAVDALALAPALGIAGMILVAFVADAFGARLGSSVAGTGVAALVGAGGYLLWLLSARAGPGTSRGARPWSRRRRAAGSATPSSRAIQG